MSSSLMEPPKAGMPGRPIGAPPFLMMSKRYWSLCPAMREESARSPGRIRNRVARQEPWPSAPWQVAQRPR